MTEVEAEHAQAIDLTQERIKRLEKDMAHATKRIEELHTMLAAFMKAITDYQEAENDNE